VWFFNKEHSAMRILCYALLLLISPISLASPKVAIASAHPLATQAGFDIIAKGGNVFDAAVAISSTLAVVEPMGSGLGGGGYWLLHKADGTETLIDGRETAPSAAHKSMYLDKNGQVIAKASLDGALAAAIPALPAALVHLAQQYGQLPLAISLAPAIAHAQNGFAINNHYLKLLKFRYEVLKTYPSSSAIFLNNGQLPQPFSILRQPDLANTLKQLASNGQAGFYSGAIAEKLVSSVQKAGGIWTLEDLKNYKVIERKPLKGNYHGITVTSAAPSSSGGTVLIETLNILSGYDLKTLDSVTQKHVITEAMRRAYHDRALYLGDTDFITAPINQLINTDYASSLRHSIQLDKATASSQLEKNPTLIKQGDNTTHFSIIDEQGNRVAATLSINFPFGSAFVAEGTGVVLNDEMDDFASAVGVANGYGLIGNEANAIAANKRMLSSMTPTFLEDANRIAVLGTPGGSRIISMVLLAALDFAQGNSVDSLVKLPRYHHQYMPDVLEYEANALSAEELNALTNKGHVLKEAKYRYGDMQAAILNKTNHQLTAASDPRGEGWAVVK
jgi:gamma-glutamyltranspeptidase/glutathione hydrolase